MTSEKHLEWLPAALALVPVVQGLLLSYKWRTRIPLNRFGPIALALTVPIWAATLWLLSRPSPEHVQHAVVLAPTEQGFASAEAIALSATVGLAIGVVAVINYVFLAVVRRFVQLGVNRGQHGG